MPLPHGEGAQPQSRCARWASQKPVWVDAERKAWRNLILRGGIHRPVGIIQDFAANAYEIGLTALREGAKPGSRTPMAAHLLRGAQSRPI